MSDFRWNKGADFKGRKWDEALPSDSVVMLTLSDTWEYSHVQLTRFSKICQARFFLCSQKPFFEGVSLELNVLTCELTN